MEEKREIDSPRRFMAYIVTRGWVVEATDY
jgi:hypothetical protein